MKSYKYKSLFFLAGFIFAALAYHNFEQQMAFEDALRASQAAEIEAQDSLEEEDLEEEEIHP